MKRGCFVTPGSTWGPAANLRNLFEMPVLFFALVPLLVIAQQATTIQVMLAWAFVALRVAHSYIHIVVPSP